MPEQRIVGAGPVRGNAGPVRGMGAAPIQVQAAAEPEQKKKSKKTPLLLIVIAILAVAVAALAMMGKLPFIGGGEAAATETVAPEPGESVAVEAISVNLSDGHYLRVGFEMQMSATAESVATAPAKDAAIELFSGRSMEDVNSETGRKELKEQLLATLNELFDGQVLGLSYTDYVTQ